MVFEKCPHCKVSLQGDLIPMEHREYYGNNTHFSRLISVYDHNEDRSVAYRCPDCEHEWKRE